MTYRAVTAWGLIAGVSITEQRELRPGLLLDLYVLRRAYDDEQHGITRGTKDDDHDIGDEDEAAFEEDTDDGRTGD